jgi:TatD DNase family protein
MKGASYSEIAAMLYDAHNHLQDARLHPWRAQVMADVATMGVAEAVVNGLTEADWPDVAALAQTHAWVRPSFGLHPWHVAARSPDWLATLEHWLRTFPGAGVGEIGLDRWIENPDVPTQVSCFHAQLALAVKWQRPATIHCLRAWGLLEETLRSQPLPARGFLLHSYSGPVEMVPGLVKKGAYFSLSPYFGHPRKAAQLATFQAVPLDRLLAETDAPDMAPPPELNEYPLGTSTPPLNHPANLHVSYALLAELRGMPLAELIGHVGANHRRLFGAED